MKKTCFLFLFFIYSCHHQYIDSCNDENYFISQNKNLNNGFKNMQRALFTTFSKEELGVLFDGYNISCKDILTDFFYCNICFNHNTNYILSYNGTRFNLDNSDDPRVFTANLVKLIRSMRMGSKEYDFFLKTEKATFSKKEENLLKSIFAAQKKDSLIPSIKIETH